MSHAPLTPLHKDERKVNLLPSAFELTPPDSQPRKRPFADMSQPRSSESSSTANNTPAEGPAPKNHKFLTPKQTTPVGINSLPAYMGYLTRQKKDRGADSVSVWSLDVEEAFMEALRKIPRVGRRKITIFGRPCGRNELISDYIYQMTGKTRTRKQVSSHIQVLKHLLKDDAEFMALVGDNVRDDDNSQISVTAPIDMNPPLTMLTNKSMGGYVHGPEQGQVQVQAQAQAHAQAHAHAHAQAQAYAQSQAMMQTPMSQPLQPPARSTSVVQLGGAPVQFNSSGMVASDDSLTPLNFCMWNTETGHIFSKLIRPQFESALRPTRGVANIAERFPRVAELLRSGRANHCQLIYGKIKLHTGTAPTTAVPDSPEAVDPSIVRGRNFSAVLEFAQQASLPSPFSGGDEVRWQVATSVVTMGHEVLSLNENVHLQQNLAHRINKLSVPFASDFWAAFIAGFQNNSSTNPKSGDKDDAETAITAITVTQRLYCRRGASGRVLGKPSDDDEQDCEDLRAIMIYEFEKAKDMFDARSIFRQVLLDGAMTTPPMPKMEVMDQQHEQQHQQESQQMLAPVPNVMPTPTSHHTVMFGSPLAKHQNVHEAAPPQIPANFYYDVAVPIQRSFSVAGFGGGYRMQAPMPSTLNTPPRGPPNQGMDEEFVGRYIAPEAIGMSRSLTAFAEPMNPWTNPDPFATPGRAPRSAESSPVGVASESWGEDKNLHNLHIDVTPYTSGLFDHLGEPLRSAPPTFSYRSFDESD